MIYHVYKISRTLRLLLLAFILSSTSLKAQITILFEQDFENGLGDMLSIDNDGLDVADGLVEELGIPATPSEWISVMISDENSVVISPSWLNPTGTADDWLITPAIEILPETVLEWQAEALNPSFRDGYQVLISTSSTDLDDFTPIMEIPAEEAKPTLRLLDLAAYAGQQIYIAFRNNSVNKHAIALDEIKVRTSIPVDLRIVDVGLTNTTFLEAGFDIDAGLPGSKQVLVEVFNVGSEMITEVSFDIETQGSLFEENHLIDLLPGQSLVLQSTAFIDFEVGEQQEYTISNITANGVSFPETIASGVSIFPYVPNYEVVGSKGEQVNIHQLLSENKTVVLDFFASWCTPCQITTPLLNAWYEANGSGAGDLEVIGIDIEPADDDEVVNSLGWGATYPKVAFTPDNELYRLHFNDIHDLNAGQLPYFVMLCPNPENVADSEVRVVHIGIPQPPSFDFWQPELEACISNLTSTDNLDVLNEEISIFPNPSDGNFYIGINEIDDNAQLTLVSPNGQFIKSIDTKTNGLIRVNLEDLDKGIYMLKFSLRDKYEVKKIIIY